ncbi:uncharacterized protein J3D65DRAFT_150072 [Phyllosticta citribraziliensis]|uniref:Uncharacterized protein n=1 Tax=Phyllosticta citribraziliensis TaxID=989973 RepID=A0ABR1L4Q3_9PEZI
MNQAPFHVFAIFSSTCSQDKTSGRPRAAGGIRKKKKKIIVPIIVGVGGGLVVPKLHNSIALLFSSLLHMPRPCRACLPQLIVSRPSVRPSIEARKIERWKCCIVYSKSKRKAKLQQSKDNIDKRERNKRAQLLSIPPHPHHTSSTHSSHHYYQRDKTAATTGKAHQAARGTTRRGVVAASWEYYTGCLLKEESKRRESGRERERRERERSSSSSTTPSQTPSRCKKPFPPKPKSSKNAQEEEKVDYAEPPRTTQKTISGNACRQNA